MWNKNTQVLTLLKRQQYQQNLFLEYKTTPSEKIISYLNECNAQGPPQYKTKSQDGEWALWEEPVLIPPLNPSCSSLRTALQATTET